MKTTITTILFLFSVICKAQPFITLGIDKTTGRGTNYKTPTGALSAGYKYGVITGELGAKLNWQEYYTPIYISAGLESKGKLMAGINGGLSYLWNLPQLDRYFHDGEMTILKEGYTTKGIWVGYFNGKLGYEIIPELKPFVSLSYCSKLLFYGVGLKFQLD